MSNILHLSRTYQIPESDRSIVVFDSLLDLVGPYVREMPVPEFREWRTGSKLDARASKKRVGYVGWLKQMSFRNISNGFLEFVNRYGELCERLLSGSLPAQARKDVEHQIITDEVPSVFQYSRNIVLMQQRR
jgi:hypothetical protein